ncbi:DUF1176 domain-containing protein [Paramagnetospirillum marisnigri]|uniref:DUF1176 domain-containing protein n=1 Tax=Paramagnetospirillum marisnigri TaxID=1285242 RepID=UPI0012E8F7CF|nr:DUF1176 domain-containing protein [Paramagnetospirillum marisnigri]
MALGQGLAICHDVVINKQGDQSLVGGKPGEGAVFTVRIRDMIWLGLCRAGIALVVAAQVMAAWAAMAAPRSVPAYAEIKDWMVACDNTRSCEAQGSSDENPGLSMIIRRNAGPEGSLEITLASESEIEPSSLMLDGGPFNTAASWAIRRDERSTMLLASGQQAAAVLKALRNGIVLSSGPRKDRSAPALSLRGLAAVLMLMDDVQGRVGGEGALALPGPAPADQVPPAPALPMVVAAAMAPTLSPQAARSLIGAIRVAKASDMTAAECEPEADVGTPHDRDRAMLLSPGEALVLLECFRGPYQSASLAFRGPTDRPTQAERLTLPLPLEAAPMDMFFSADYDPTTHIFAMKANGRGLGDCGRSASWVFDGRRFQLAAYAKQGRCGGIVSWPVLWRSANVPVRP